MSVYIFLVVLTIVVCLFLAVAVLVQNPKGGGLDASFGGVSNNTFGAQRTTDFLEKATWFLAVTLVVLSLGSALYLHNWQGGSDVKDIMNTKTESTTDEGVFEVVDDAQQPAITPAPNDETPNEGN